VEVNINGSLILYFSLRRNFKYSKKEINNTIALNQNWTIPNILKFYPKTSST